MSGRPVWVPILLVLAVSVPPAGAQTTSGRLTTSFSLQERADSTTGETTYARIYETVQLSHLQRDFGVHLYGQIDGDAATDVADDPKIRAYNLYVEWRNIARHGAARIGRIPVFAGAASATLDGAELRFRGGPVRLEAFGGALLPPHQDLRLVDDVGDNYMVGGQALLLPARDLRIGATFFDRRRLRSGFETTRSDSIGNLYPFLVPPSNRDDRIASLDASWTVRPATAVAGRADWDFHGRQLVRGELSGRSAVSRSLTVRGGYTYRSPRLPRSSIFSVFDVEENHEIEGGVHLAWRTGWALRGEVAGILYSGDESYRGTVGVDTPLGEISYVRRSGYAGELDGVNASVRRAMWKGRVTPLAQVSWASWRPDPERGKREDTWTGVAGVSLRPGARYSLDLEAQYLRNPRYEDDLRLFARLQYWFFKKWKEASK